VFPVLLKWEPKYTKRGHCKCKADCEKRRQHEATEAMPLQEELGMDKIQLSKLASNAFIKQSIVCSVQGSGRNNYRMVPWEPSPQTLPSPGTFFSSHTWANRNKNRNRDIPYSRLQDNRLLTGKTRSDQNAQHRWPTIQLLPFSCLQSDCKHRILIRIPEQFPSVNLGQ